MTRAQRTEDQGPRLGLLIPFLLAGGLARGLAATPSQLPRPTIPAQPLQTAPVVDGEILEDPVWSSVEPTGGFWQVRPAEGEPASERTEVRIGFTSNVLYFGIICFDRDAKGIIVSDTRRDASLTDTDSVQIILDTFHDEQNGFVFGTNPAGIEYDGQVKNASESFGGPGGGGGRRFGGGTGGGFNINWDGVWEVKTKTGSYGWSAEFAIPFTTLRYPTQPSQIWGVNFQRNIRRHNETAYWAPLDRQFNLYRLTDAGTLEEISPPRQRNLKLAPYAKFQAQRRGEEGAPTEEDADWGVDLKYSLNPALTLDATYNTDFAQVEVDEQQINLDRFNLFFPEKRPFFLENAGLFAVGATGEADLFFSRRIGLSEDGDEIPILGGLRVTGKLQQRTNLGLLAMQTEAVNGVSPANNFGVARLSRELPNRSSIGAILVGREATGSGAGDGGENQTFGVDGQLGIGEYYNVSGFAAKTETPELDGRDHAHQLSASFASPTWSWNLAYMEVGEDFNPEVGFLTRSGYRQPTASLRRRVRPKNLLGLFELRPHVFYRGFWDFDGFQETGFLHVDNHWEWPSGAQVHTGVNFTLDGLKEPFEITDGVVVPAGTYENDELQLVLESNAGAPVSVRSRVLVGGFFDGDRVSVNTTLNLRRGEWLTSEIGWSYNDIDLRGGAFETNLGRLRISYSLSTRLLLQALVQYNDVEGEVATNLRFSWLRRASTGLFVVYNELQELGSLALPRPGREIIVKYSHLIDIFR